MGIPIVIPSHKRADRVKASGAVLDPILCVPESQKDAYAAHNPDTEIVSHPDSLLGLGPKRQWIHDHFGDVCMVDDDVDCFMRLYLPIGKHAGRARLTGTEARDMLQATGETARRLGAFLFGVSNWPDPRNFLPFRPFRLTGVLGGGCVGILKGSKIRFSPKVLTGEDYYTSGLNAYHHRYLFIDTRFGLKAVDTFRNTGGCSEYRTMESEAEAYKFLRDMFGEAIQPKSIKMGWGQFKRHISAHERVFMLPFGG